MIKLGLEKLFSVLYNKCVWVDWVCVCIIFQGPWRLSLTWSVSRVQWALRLDPRAE